MERKLPIRQTQDNPIYAGLVESMDDAVGILLEGLKKLKLDKNTIIIFTSDNGGVSSGDAFSTSNLPYRGGKGYQWEGGSRVPYVLYIPWLKSNGKKCDYPVTGTDFFPTILDYSNINLIPKQHKGWRHIKIPSTVNDAIVGDKNVYTTAEDLFKWTKGLNSGSFLTKQSLALMYSKGF